MSGSGYDINVFGMQGQLEFERMTWWPVALVVLLLGFGLSVWGYSLWHAAPRRVESVSRLAGLLGVRMMALVLLAVMLLGPVWKRPARPEEEGGVAFLVDTSLSMSVADTQRTTAERLRLAEALGLWTDPLAAELRRMGGMLKAIETGAQGLVRLRDEIDAIELTRRDPREAQARLAGSRQEFARARQRAAQDSVFPPAAAQAIEKIDVSDEVVGTGPWLADVGKLLAEARTAIDAARDERRSQLARSDPATSLAASNVGAMDRLDVAKAMLADGPQSLVSELPPRTPWKMYRFDRDVAQITKADLVQLGAMGTGTDLSLAISAAGREPLWRARAIVAFTDGRQTLPMRPISEDVPVLAVNVAAETPSPVVNFKAVEMPATLSTGQVAKIKVRLGAASPQTDQAVTVRMLAAGQTQVRQMRIVGEVEEEAEFDILADRPGGLIVELSLETGASTVVGGVNVPLAAKRIRRVIQVVSERSRVLLVTGGVLTWDAQALRDQLSMTAGVRMMVARAGEDDLTPLIRRSETVVIAGVEPLELSAETRGELADFVSRRGGTLLFLSDSTWIPHAWLADAELANFMPAVSGEWKRTQGAEGAYFATVASENLELGSQSDWAGRSAIHRFFVFNELKPLASAWLTERASGEPLLTSMRMGLGKVLVLATDQAWRWQISSSAEAGAFDFWQRLMRRSVEPRYAVTEGNISLDASVVGDVLEVRVRQVDRDGAPVRTSPAPVVAVRFEGRTVRNAGTVETSPGRYQARVTGLGEGEYTVSLQDQEQPRMTVLLGDSGQAELSDLTSDRRGLGRLVQPTGGAVYTPAEASKLANDLKTVLARPGMTITSRLWDTPATLLLLVALLAIEWALRKHWGLA